MRQPSKIIIPNVDLAEGPEAWDRFRAAMRAAVSLPRTVLKDRIEAARRESAANPNRRGPKRKPKPSV